MQYALFPFPSLREAGGGDIRSALRRRGMKSSAPIRGISNIELLEHLVERLRELPWEVAVDYCHEALGDLRLAVVAKGLGRNVEVRDVVQAGFCLENSETMTFKPFAATRVFRVACENGYLVETEQGQSAVLSTGADWRTAVAQVVDKSFSAEGLDRDAAHFRAAMAQMLMTPYELLCNLVAQGYISDEEQSAIQAEFDEVGDFTLYGLINAVTRIAGQCRDSDDWKRAVELERLGGEVLRGDHQPPVFDPVYS
jgi:hypothetical protein